MTSRRGRCGRVVSHARSEQRPAPHPPPGRGSLVNCGEARRGGRESCPDAERGGGVVASGDRASPHGNARRCRSRRTEGARSMISVPRAKRWIERQVAPTLAMVLEGGGETRGGVSPRPCG